MVAPVTVNKCRKIILKESIEWRFGPTFVCLWALEEDGASGFFRSAA